jgi:ribonuclease P protein component
MIKFNNRFHGHNSLLYVYRNGKVVRSHLIAMRFTTNSHRKESRVAVVVSKKTLKSAVRRNRIRRRIYEYMRNQLPQLRGVYDVVLIVQNGEVLGLTSAELADQLEQLIGQAGLKNAAKDIPKPA